MKIDEWFEYVGKRGTSGDMVYDILNDWKRSNADLEAAVKEKERRIAGLKTEKSNALQRIHDGEKQIAELTAEITERKNQKDDLLEKLTILKAENERLRGTGQNLQKYLIENISKYYLPDEIWVPFMDALKEAKYERV